MGLIAREIEGRGVPTLCLSSALSITRAVNPPRAVFLDFPLGHTCGKAGAPELQRAILWDALRAFETIGAPGEVVPLRYAWAEDDAWKDAVMRRPEAAGRGPGVEDQRVARDPTPQYQSESDRVLAEAELARGGCPTCVWLEDAAPR